MGDKSAIISFVPPVDTGGASITGYTVKSIPGNITATGSSSPISVTGLTNGVSYAFTVHATNVNGDSIESELSNSIIPFSTITQEDVSLFAVQNIIPQLTFSEDVSLFAVQNIIPQLTFSEDVSLFAVQTIVPVVM